MNEHPEARAAQSTAERLAAALESSTAVAGRRSAESDLDALVALAAAITALPPLDATRRAAIDAAVAGAVPAPTPRHHRPGSTLVVAALLGGALWAALGGGDGAQPATAPASAPRTPAAEPSATLVRRRASLDDAARTPAGRATGPAADAARPAQARPPLAAAAPSRAPTAHPPAPPTALPAPAASDRAPVSRPATAGGGERTAPAPSPPPSAAQAPCGPDMPAHGVAVHVVDDEGRPVGDAELAIGAAPDGPLDVFAVTGDDGCRHVGLGPGRYHLRARADGRTRWYPHAADRDAADVLDLGDARADITVTLGLPGVDDAAGHGAAATSPVAPVAPGAPNAADGDGAADAGDAAGTVGAPPGVRPQLQHAGPNDAPLDASQAGGAVTAVAHDDARDVLWAVVGPRVTAWRHDGGWQRLGVSAVLPSVPEALAVGDGRVVVGVRVAGRAELWVLDAAWPSAPPIVAQVPLARSGATAIGAVAVGGTLAWAVTDRGVSIVDLKPTAPVERGVVATADGRVDAMDALDWQGGITLSGDPTVAVVARPWGLWVVDALDPDRPRVRSGPPSRPDDRAWPAFAVAARGREVVVVDVAAPGPGIVRIVDIVAPDRPVVVAERDLADAASWIAPTTPHPRDDPRGGRSRGPSVAWRGDHVVVVAADGTGWTALRRSTGLRGDPRGGALAAWSASRAAVALVGRGEDGGSLPTVAVAAGDAGLIGVADGVARTAPAIPPPLWQSTLGIDGRHLLGAAGPAGLAVVPVTADGLAPAAPWALDHRGTPCGAVTAVAAGAVDVALTQGCGLVTLAVDAGGRPSVVGALPWRAPPPAAAGTVASPLAAHGRHAAWIERRAIAGPVIVAADVGRPAQPVAVDVAPPADGTPIAVGWTDDALWSVVVAPLGDAALWRWPIGALGRAPTRWADLDRAHRVIDAAPSGLRLSWPLGDPAVAAVGTAAPVASVASRRGPGMGRAATATMPLGRALWLASDGHALVALDAAADLATIGAGLELPHGQLVDAWSTSPQRDDVHVVGRDVVVSLGDAGIVRLPEAVVRASTTASPAARATSIYLPVLGAARGSPAPRAVVLVDGTAAAAAWFAANGGGDTLAAAVDAWRRARPDHAFDGATWGAWAEHAGPLAPATAGRLVARIATAPAHDRRADAALALAHAVLDRPGLANGSAAGADVVVLLAAGDSAPASVPGAEARARRLRVRGAAFVVVTLGALPDAPGLERIARAAGGAVVAAVSAEALARALDNDPAAP